MKKFKKFLAVLLSVLFVAGCFAACSDTSSTSDSGSADDASATATGSDLQYIKDKGTMIIGITEYEPMNYRDENKNWTGFDTEFAEAVCEKLGVTPEFQVIDWDNKIFELDSKAIDCCWNGMTLTDEVMSAMSCTEPYVKNEQMLVMKSDVIANYPDTASLAGVTFAAESGSAGASAIEDAGYADNMTTVSAQSDALLEVESGSVQACVIDSTMAKAMTGEGTSYADLATGFALTSEEYGIGFRKDSDVTAEVNKIIEEMKADGSLQELADKYQLTLA